MQAPRKFHAGRVALACDTGHMNNRVQIEATDLSGMVSHWLGCPPGGYLGSDYGSDVAALLQTPLGGGLADGLIAKARADIPLLSQAAPGAVDVFAESVGVDRLVITMAVAGELIEVGISQG